MDLSWIQGSDREHILVVLHRDQQLRQEDGDRVRRLKQELQDELQDEHRRRPRRGRRGGKMCARCHMSLGKLWNRGDVCWGCSHRTCSGCRVTEGPGRWKCTACFASRNVKIRSGEWFLEEKAKKFPPTGKDEAVGERLLTLLGVLSHIAIVPPTPPPHLECGFTNKSGDFKKCSSARSSREDLRLSVTTGLREKWTSGPDVRVDLLTVENKRPFHVRIQKSLSDTDIGKSLKRFSVANLPNVFKKNRESDAESCSAEAEDDASFTSRGSAGNGDSGSSLSIDGGAGDAFAAVGELQLAVAYNSATCCLEVSVGSFRSLSSDGPKKNSNVRVKLCVLPDRAAKLKATVKTNCTESHRHVLVHHIERPLLFGKHIQAQVFHLGSFRRKLLLGEVVIPLDGWASGKVSDESLETYTWYQL